MGHSIRDWHSIREWHSIFQSPPKVAFN